ncbi:cupin domain-containing protein [Methylophaga sp. UBA1464]|uniref:cupin domain-containing protein n=2 Tax=Methylophaga TaxID=40222 RepID=UPI0025E7950C|nr:cupin domain-containing protein [Methylophaga sp. UBA1464]
MELKMNSRLTTIGAVALGLSMGSLAMAHGAVEHETENKRLKFFENAQQMELASMEEPGVAAFFDDIVGSGNPKSPISCGLFKIDAGNPLVYTYDYDDIKMMLEGSITFSDGEQEVTAEAGDVLFFPNGSTITFSTESSGLAFACGQRAEF